MAVDRCRKGALLIVAMLEMALCLVPGIALAIGDTSGSNYETVEVTGLNVDVVADGTKSGEALKGSVTGYIDLDNDGGGHAYYAGGTGKHLPDDGRITLSDEMAFQLRDYGQSNALRLEASHVGTLDLVVPRNECKRVVVLCTAAGTSEDGAYAKLVVTPLYGSEKNPAIDENGNPVSQALDIPDWYRSVNDSSLIYNRIRVSDGMVDDGFALYVTEGIDVDPSKELTAIQFENTGGEIATIFAVSVLPLEHNWSYSVFGATITATCEKKPCSVLTNPTLAIVAPTLAVEGGEGNAEATVKANRTWTTDNELPDIPEVVYWNGETQLDEPPTTVGSYKAEITVEGVTAKLEYTIEAKTSAVITKRPEAKNLIYDGNAQELVSAGEATGGTMKYALGSDAKNAPVDGWDTAVPSGTDVGTYYVWYKALGDANHVDSEAASVTAAIAAPSYAVTSGAGSTWTEDSGKGLSFTFKRPGEGTEDMTFSHFASASVDGKELVRDTDYTATKGSVLITLVPAYLEKLGVGKHTLMAIFDDGSAEAAFTVAEASATVTVTFDANGGKGTMDKMSVAAGETVLLTKNAFTRDGYTFSGWNTKADGSGTSYKDGASVKVSSDVTLYAQWAKSTASPSSNTATSGTSGTITTSGTTSTSTTLARTDDPTSVVAVLASVTMGATALAVGWRGRR